MNDNPKVVDPGWNDPPMLNYSASNPPPKSRIANKRIAFPLNNTSESTSSAQQKLTNTIPPLATETAGEQLTKLLSTDEAKQNFSKVWSSELPEEFRKSIILIVSSLASNNKDIAALHKQTLLSKYKTLCDGWLDNIKF